MIPIGKLFDSISFKHQRSNSPNQKAVIKNSGDNNQVTINQMPPQSERDILLGKIRNAWLLSNDGISPERMAGLEWGNGEKEWVNQKLADMGQDWKV